MEMNRRAFMLGSAAAAAFSADAVEKEPSGKRDVVVYVAAHPDDLAGSIGTVMRLAERFEVHVVDFTHGERGLGESGCRDGSTRRLRTAEEEKVCREIGVKLHWCDEIDGEAFAGRGACEALAGLFRTLKPRALIVHWLLDTHDDHMMSATAAIKAAKLADVWPEIYFQEQERQSRGFPVAYFVDVSALEERRRRLISLYGSQDGPAMAERKIRASIVNGGRAGLRAAEVFGVFPGTIRSSRGVFDELPGTVRS